MFKKEKETEKNSDSQLDEKINNSILNALVKYGLIGVGTAIGSVASIKAHSGAVNAGLPDNTGINEDIYSLTKQKVELEKQLNDISKKYEKEIEVFNIRLETAEKLQNLLENEKTELLNKNEKLKQDLDDLARSSKRNIADLNEKLAEREQSLSRLEEAYNAHVNKINALKVPDLIEAYLLFSHLNSHTRDNLRGIFETDNFLGFVSNSMQWERIVSIWEQAKHKIVNDDKEDVDVLRKLFKALLDIYNAGYNEAPYKLITPKIDSRYNSADSVIIGQKSDGIVKKVLLEGYIQVRNNIVNKALVQVE